MPMDVYVSPPGSIQAGIGAVDPGGTVHVYPGTYNERILITKPLTLTSTGGAAITIIDGNSATENYYMVQIEASNVTVDGFTITNPLYSGTADAAGVVIGAESKNSNIHITNNIIRDIGISTRSPVSFGTFGINIGPVDTLVVENNTIYSIANNDAAAYAMGIFVWGNGPGPADVANNVTIYKNTVYNIVNPGGVNDGINLGGDSQNVSVDSNTINAAVKRGIVTNSLMDGAAAITNNVVTNTIDYGIYLRSPYEQVVRGNTVTGGAVGIEISTTSSPPTVYYNNIYGHTTFGLDNQSSNQVFAQTNWWGSASGPNQPGADQVNGDVDFTQWLIAPFQASNRGLNLNNSKGYKRVELLDFCRK